MHTDNKRWKEFTWPLIRWA